MTSVPRVPRVPRFLGFLGRTSAAAEEPRHRGTRGTGRAGGRGYSLIEIVVVMAIFGIFLYIVVMLTAEMKRNEKKWPVNFMTHPDVSAVIARLRRDVEDAKAFPVNFNSYTQDQKTLIIYTILQTGFAETVVYDFNTAGEVHRLSFTATQQTSEWVAHGVPTFHYDRDNNVNGEPAVHISAVDSNNKLAIDQIIVPRPHD